MLACAVAVAVLLYLGKGTSSERGCTMAHLRMITAAYDAGHATAVMLEGDASLRLMACGAAPWR